MNASLISHQFRFELRRQPWLTAAYAAAGVLLPLAALVAGSRLGREAAQWNHLALFGLLAAAGAILLERGLTATPFSGSTGFWMTRPIPRSTIFWSKSVWLAVLVVVPPALGWALRALALRLAPAQAAAGAAFVAAVILVAVLAASVVTALARSRREGLALASGFAAAATASLLVLVVATRTTIEQGLPFEAMLRTRAVVFLGVLMAAFTAAWFLAARRGRRGPAIALLFGGAVPAFVLAALWRHDFMSGPGAPTREVTVSVSRPAGGADAAVADPDRRPLLWSALEIGGLGEREIVVPTSVRASLAAGDAPAADLAPFPPLSISRIDDAAALRIIAGDFPDATSWSGGAARPKALLAPTSGTAPRRGALEGALGAAVLRIHREAELPLEIGARAGIEGGGSVAITERIVDGNALRVVARFDVPAAGGANLFEAGELRGSPPVWAVLHHPGDGHAAFRTSDGASYQNYESATPIRAFSNGFTFVLPLLRIGLLGGTVDEWLGEARLVIYAGRPAGRFVRSFAAADFALPDGTTLPGGSPDLPAAASPPPGADATAGEFSAHIDRLVHGARDATGYAAFEEALMALPDRALGVLADRVPCHEMVDSAILRVLGRRLSATPPDALVRGVSRSLRFLPLCRSRGLAGEVAPIVREQLARRVPLPFGTVAPAIALLAETGDAGIDPGLVADVRWHFEQAGAEQGDVAEVLEQVAGFEIDSVLRTAWARSRLMGEEAAAAALAPFALRFGDPEALRLSLAQRPHLPPASSSRRRLDARLDASLAPSPGSPDLTFEEKLAHAHAGFRRIAWDGDAGRFLVP